MINMCATCWNIKLNGAKSTQETFTLRNLDLPSVTLMKQIFPTINTVKHLGLTINKRLTSSWHIKLKYKSVSIFNFFSSNYSLNLNYLSNKLMLYKSIKRPVLFYSIQIWGLAKPYNIKILQAFQSNCLQLKT